MEKKKMMGAVLPGNSTVELREFDVPTPGHVTQLRDYRQALAALTGYAPADIRTVLLFTRAGRAVEVPGA